MHNMRLAGVLRYISILIIFLVVFLYFTLNILIDDVVPEIDDTKSGKEYKYLASPGSEAIPEFTYYLESIFLKNLIPVVVETKIINESLPSVAVPILQFVGMIEIEKKIIYSFRNKDTNKLLLFEKGVVLEGIMLVSAEEKKYTFKKNEIKFQVDK